MACRNKKNLSNFVRFLYNRCLNIICKIQQITSPPSFLDLCIYRNDPPACVINTYRISSFIVFTFYLAIFLVPKLVLNYINGNIVSTTFITDLTIDIRVFPLFKWIFIFADSSTSMSLQSSTNIPYLRDYADWLVMILMAAHMSLIYKMWHNISFALTSLWRNHLLNKELFTKKDYQRIINKYNHLYNKKLWNYLCFSEAVVMTILLYYAISLHGIYSGLNPSYSELSSEWEKLAYNSWWGHPSNGWPVFLFQCSVVVIILYYMFFSVFAQFFSQLIIF